MVKIGWSIASAGVVLASTLLIAGSSAGDPIGSDVVMVVDGRSFDIPLITDEQGVTVLDAESCPLSQAPDECTYRMSGRWLVQISAELDSDPSISYGVSVIDFGAPSSFSFLFTQAVLPQTAPGVVTASLSGSTTNGGGVPGSVTITPNPPPGFIPVDGDLVAELQVYTLSQDGGVTFLNAGLDLGPLFTSNPLLVSDTYGSFSGGPAAGPAGAGTYNFMRVDVRFGLSGGGDVLTLNGGPTIIPEPTPVALLALGLGVLGARRRRQA